MFDKLIIEAFNKAKKDTNSEVVSQLSNHISDVIFEDYKFQISERTLRNYYNKIKKDQEEEDISLSSQISLHLARYTGYKDFKEFIALNSEDSNNGNKFFVKNVFSIKAGAVSFITILVIYLAYNNYRKECMIWVDNSHYKTVKCEEGIESGAILFNEAIFDKMKRIDPDCNYPFFKSDGSSNLWYLKDANGTVEFYTYHGTHPLTKKTLKPVTNYIIDKYICENKGD